MADQNITGEIIAAIKLKYCDKIIKSMHSKFECRFLLYYLSECIGELLGCHNPTCILSKNNPCFREKRYAFENNLKLSHSEVIEVLRDIIRDVNEYDVFQTINGLSGHIGDIYIAIANETLTFDDFLNYEKVISSIKTYVNYIPQPIIGQYNSCLFIPTKEHSSCVSMNKHRFTDIVRFLYETNAYKLHCEFKAPPTLPIQLDMIRRGMEYFDYPQTLIDKVFNPPSLQIMVIGYINNKLYYDFIDREENINDPIYVIINGKKYHEHANLYYKRASNTGAFKAKYTPVKKIQLRGFLKQKFKITSYICNFNIDLNEYLSNMELPWRESED